MRREVLICLLLAGITLGLFWPLGQLGFYDSDDPEYILTNPMVRDGLSPQSVWWALTTYHASNWHPVTWLSLMLDCQLFGPNPRLLHLENVAWHTANALLLFLLLCKITRLRSEATAPSTLNPQPPTAPQMALWRSAFVAALFAWHPTHLQSVAWIVERKDVLSGFFMLLTLLTYAEYVERSEIGSQRSEIGDQKPETRDQKSEGKHPTAERRPRSNIQHPTSIGGQGPTSDLRPPPSALRPLFPLPSSLFYLVSLVCFALGLMSKPMLVTLPVILLLLDFWPLRRFTIYDLRSPPSALRPLLLEKWRFAALSLLTVMATILAQGAAISLVKLPLLERLANAPVFVVWYLEKLLWPVNLAIYYPYRHIPFWEQAACCVLLVLVTMVCLWRLRSNPQPSTLNPQRSLLMGWLWFLIMLLPVIGLLQVGGQSVADRYTYLPSIGLFIAVVWGLAPKPQVSGFRSPASGLVWPALGVVCLLACLVDTRWQMQYWQSDAALHQRAVEVTRRNNVTSYCALGNAQWVAGDLDAAARSFQAALQTESDYAWQKNDALCHHLIGRVRLCQNQPAEAAAQFEAALNATTSQAESAIYHKYLGDALDGEGKGVEAENEYALAEQLLPENTRLRQEIATSRSLAGLREAAKAGPTPEGYMQMAAIEAGLQLDRNALEHYLTALKLKPEAPEILNNLAWLLATSRNNKLRDGNRAIQYGRQACELTQNGNPACLGTLAAAYAEAGKFDDAIATAQQACDLASKAGDAGLLQKNQELLQRYRAHQTALDGAGE